MFNHYSPFSSFVIRTPSLPFQDIKSLEKVALSGSGSDMDPFIMEAIFIASPHLHEELTKRRLNNEITNSPKKNDKAQESFFKYLVRMSSRCTPFGLFSSCSAGKIGITTSLLIKENIQRKTRVDTKVLFDIYSNLNERVEIRRRIKYYSNNTIYPIANKYRYIDRTMSNEKVLFSISSVKKSPILEHILSLAENGIYFEDLLLVLREIDYSETEGTEFIEELIEANLLVSEFEVLLSGNNTESTLPISDTLKNFDNSLFQVFTHIDGLLSKLDSNRNNEIKEYEEINQQIAELSNSTKIDGSVFQVDLSRQTEHLSIGNDILQKLEKVINFFAENSTFNRKSTLREFQDAFFERYEHREMPLSLVLDPDIGLGYPLNYGQSDNPSKLIKTLETLIKHNYKNESNDSINEMLKKKLINSSTQEVIVFEETVEKRIETKHLPDTLYLFFQIIKTNNTEPLLYVKGFGAGGANLLSRFTHLDSNISSLVKEITDKEAEMNKDAIVAEIIHLPPNPRVGNILKRDQIRSHEICYFTRSDLPKDRQIPISDIMISIKNNQLFLRSQKYDKLIIPKLTTAHNFYNDTLPVYKFLCDYQNKDTFSGFEVHFGELSNSTDFLPRVCLGNTVLFLATWKVNYNEFKVLDKNDDSDHYLEKWRTSRKIPNEVLLVQGDNELLLDFSCNTSVRLFFSELSKKKNIELKEFLYDKTNLPVQSQNGYYLNECIIPFYRNKK